MNTIDPCDPYGTSLITGSKAAALVVGRSLTRLAFYLSQAVLVSRASDFEECTSRARGTLGSINSRVGCLDADHANQISRLLGTCSEEIFSSWFGDDCSRTLSELEREFESRPEDEMPVKEVVDRFATPWRERIETIIRSNVPETSVAWFDLGKKLEEGLCRPDIYRFQLPCLWGPKILRADEYLLSSYELGNYDWLGDDADRPSGSVPANRINSVDYISREPADVIPQSLWCSEVIRLWHSAGADDQHLNPLRNLSRIRQKRQDFRKALIEVVQVLFRDAYFAAAAGVERLRIDLDHGELEFDGRTFVVGREVAVMIHELQDGETSFNRIKQKHQQMFGKHDKLRDVLARMPQEIADLIEHGRGKETKFII